MAHITSVIHFGGSPSIRGSLKRGTERLLRMIGTYLLLSLIMMIPGLLMMFMFASFITMSVPLGMVIWVVMVSIGIFVMVKLAFITQAVFVENLSVTGALGRSWNLVSNNWWSTFGYLLVILLIGFAISLVFTFIPFIGQLISIFIATPIMLIGTTLIYWDLRAREETVTVDQVYAELDTSRKESELFQM